MSFIGFGFGYRRGIISGLVAAILSWVFALVGAYVGAFVIEKLAPTFKSSGSTIQALKLVVYASTPVWVAVGCRSSGMRTGSESFRSSA